MFQFASYIMIVIYIPSNGQVTLDYRFIVLATVITIVNYYHTVIMIVNYSCKTFIVHATGLGGKRTNYLNESNFAQI
jgi:hypothetical protein